MFAIFIRKAVAVGPLALTGAFQRIHHAEGGNSAPIGKRVF